METKFHAICRGHEQECSFKTILHGIENAYDLKVSKTWKRRLEEKMCELNDAEAAIAKVLDGADESDADVAKDSEPEPDAPLRP